MWFIHVVPNIKISVYAKNQVCRCPTYHTKRAVLIQSLRRRPYRMKPTAVGFISLTTVVIINEFSLDMLKILIIRIRSKTTLSKPPPHHSGNEVKTLQWRHNGPDGVSNHRPHDFFLNRLFRRRSKKTSNIRVTGLCVGNSPVTGEFPAQMASNAENVSIGWRHHELTEHRCLVHSIHLTNETAMTFSKGHKFRETYSGVVRRNHQFETSVSDISQIPTILHPYISTNIL